MYKAVSMNEEKKTEYAPAGKLSTPAPTILLTRLKISSGIVAVPSVDIAASPPSPPPDISNAVVDHDDDDDGRWIVAAAVIGIFAIGCC